MRSNPALFQREDPIVSELLGCRSTDTFMAVCDAKYDYHTVKRFSYPAQALIRLHFFKLAGTEGKNMQTIMTDNTKKLVVRTEIIEIDQHELGLEVDH